MPGVLGRQLRRLQAVMYQLPRYVNRQGPQADALFLTLAAIVGLLGAAGVHAFFWLIDVAHQLLVERPLRWELPAGRWIVTPLLTAASLALAAWIMRRIGEAYDGLNVPDVAHAVTARGGQLPGRASLAKAVASAVTIGGGGAAGSEGPVAVLGGALASAFARPLKLKVSRVRTLVGAGTAAGISATFSAPMAGAFFALEEILHSSSTTAFAPVVVSSVVAYVASTVIFGAAAPFPEALRFGYRYNREVFLFFPLLGVLTGFLAGVFVRLEDRVAKARWRRRTPRRALPWVGGALVGLIAVAGHGYLSSRGHFAINFAALSGLRWWALILLAFGMIVSTVITLNTGGSGGVFAPSLTVGAMAGTALGLLLRQLFPSLPLVPASYALAGMGSLVAASTGAPITAILLVFEISDDHAIILPLMLAVVISVLVRRMMTGETLYTAWLRRTGRLPQRIDSDRDDTSTPTAEMVPFGPTGEWLAPR